MQLIWTLGGEFATLPPPKSFYYCDLTMFTRPIIRLSLAASLLLASGCARWRPGMFDLNRLRDPRAVDIDSRFSAPETQSTPRGE